MLHIISSLYVTGQETVKVVNYIILRNCVVTNAKNDTMSYLHELKN